MILEQALVFSHPKSGPQNTIENRKVHELSCFHYIKVFLFIKSRFPENFDSI